MSDVLNVLTSIENYLVDLPAKIILRGNQIFVVNGLSDISESLGILTAGEFRSGNRLDPGNGFSGMRMLYPPVTYNSELWNLVGVENDVLQFGVRASDGKLLAGGGAVILDSSGITAVGGTIAGWTIDTTELTNTKIKISSAGSIESIPFVSGIGGGGWKISEDGDVEFNNAVIRGELRTTVLTYQEIQAVAGTMGVFQSAGVLKADLVIPTTPSGQFDLVMKAPNSTNPDIFGSSHILQIKNGTQSTWFICDLGHSTSGNGYTYYCSYLSGTTDVTYTTGQAVISYGVSGDGFLLMEAIGTGAPYFSVRTHAGAPQTATTEHVRMGNLNGNWGYSSDKYGVAIGQYVEDKPNIILDEDGSLTINIYDGTTNNPVLQFDDTGSFITNVLNMTGASAAIAIGTTPPTSSTIGTGIWIDRTGIFVLVSDIQEIAISAGLVKFGYRVIDAYDGGGGVTAPEQAYHWSYLNNDGIRFRLVYNPRALGLKVSQPTGNKIIWSDLYHDNETTNFTIDSDAQGDESQYMFSNLSTLCYPTDLSAGYAGINLFALARGGNSSTLTVESGTQGDGIALSSRNVNIKDGFLNPWYYLGNDYNIAYVSTSSIKIYSPTSYGTIAHWFPTGTKVKFMQTTEKFFYVVSTSWSAPWLTVTLTGGSDYTVANATITGFYYSHGLAYGFPEWFNCVSTPLGAAGSAGAYADSVFYSKFSIVGRRVHLAIRRQVTNLGSWSGLVYFTAPFNVAPAIGIQSFVNAGGFYRYNSTTHSPIISLFWGGSSFIFQKKLYTFNGQWSDLLANDFMIIDVIYSI